MLIAINKQGNRVHIDDILENEEYFCTSCGEKVSPKKGKIRMHHFAHKKGSICSDTWNHEITQWHLDWQNRFPKETQEIVKEKDGEKHRADVLIESTKTVIEFQHSPLTPDEFSRRNNFYLSLGYQVIWVFDVIEQYNTGTLYNESRDLYFRWKRARDTFKFFDSENSDVVVYLQIKRNIDEEKTQDITKSLNGTSEDLSVEIERYIEKHKDDVIELKKVVWNEKNGFSYFKAERGSYYLNDFVEFYTNVQIKSKYKANELSDNLLRLVTRKNANLFFGCPLSEIHMSKDTYHSYCSDERTKECLNCIYSNPYCDYFMGCYKRIDDLKLKKTDVVTNVEVDKKGFIKKIEIIRNGENKIIDLYDDYLKEDTIFNLWKKLNICEGIFYNVEKEKYVRIKENPFEQYKKYKRVCGFISEKYNGWYSSLLEIFYVNKPEWICVWYKK